MLIVNFLIFLIYNESFFKVNNFSIPFHFLIYMLFSIFPYHINIYFLFFTFLFDRYFILALFKCILFDLYDKIKFKNVQSKIML